MRSLLQFREAIAFLLTLFFGYVAPCLNTVKAVLDRDAKAVKTYLTYWVVFLLSIYFGMAIRLISSVSQRRPPELKVLFILWLTLPRFNGALRLYIYVIKPYFDKYEDDIDSKLASVASEVKSRASRHIKVILWQLFLSPNDGVLSAAITGVNTLIGSKNEFSWPNFLMSQLSAAGNSTSANAPVVNLSSASLSKQLVSEFSRLLNDGMYLEVWRGSEDDIIPCEIQLLQNNRMLGISTATGVKPATIQPGTTNIPVNMELEDGDEMQTIEQDKSAPPERLSMTRPPGDILPPHSSIIESNSDEQLSTGVVDSRQSRRHSFTKSRILSCINVQGDATALKVPLMLISDVNTDNEQSLVVNISIPIDILTPAACFAFAQLFVQSNTSNSANESSAKELCRTATLCLLAEGPEEAEAFQVGLQLLIRSARSTASKCLQRILRFGIGPRRAQIAALQRWKDHVGPIERSVALFSNDGTSPNGMEIDDHYGASPSRLESKFRAKYSSQLATALRAEALLSQREDSDDDYGEIEMEAEERSTEVVLDVCSTNLHMMRSHDNGDSDGDDNGDDDDPEDENVLLEADMDEYYLEQMLLHNSQDMSLSEGHGPFHIGETKPSTKHTSISMPSAYNEAGNEIENDELDDQEDNVILL